MNNAISGLTGAQIQDYLTQFNAAHKSAGVNAELKVNEAGETLVIVTGKGGVTRSLAVTDLPEIDSPEDIPGEEAAEALEKLADKLAEIANELKGDPKKPAPSMNVFCDIFALIHLLMEVAQKQQQTAAAIRQQGHAAVQANLQAQADSIRSQAQNAYELGLASAIMSSVMTAASLAMTVAGGVMQAKAAKAADMNGAEADLKNAQNQLKTTTEAFKAQEAKPAEGQQPVATKSKEEMLKELGFDKGDVQANEQAFKEQYMPETAKAEPAEQQAKADWDKAKTQVDETKTVRDQADQKLNDLNAADKARADLDTFKENHPEKDGWSPEKGYEMLKKMADEASVTPEEVLDALKPNDLSPQQLADLKECIALHKAVDTTEAKLSTAEKADLGQAIKDARKELIQAQKDYDGALKAADDAHAKWSVKSTELQKAQEKDAAALNEKIAAAEADLKKTADTNPAKGEKQQKVNDLKQAKKIAAEIEKVQDKDTQQTILDGLKLKVTAARDKMTSVVNAMGLTKNARVGKMLESLVNVTGQFSNSISGFINTVKERNAGLGEAKRKEVDAEIDKGRALIEQADDLRQSAQKQVNDFIQILASIQQIQTQTNLQMIRG